MLKGYQNKNKKHVLVTASQDFLLSYWNKLRTDFCFCGWEVHPEPTQTSKIEFFAKVINTWKSLTVCSKSSILDIWLGSVYASVHRSHLAVVSANESVPFAFPIHQRDKTQKTHLAVNIRWYDDLSLMEWLTGKKRWAIQNRLRI